MEKVRRISMVLSVSGLFALIVAMGVAMAAPTAGTLTVDQSVGGCVSSAGQSDPYGVVYCGVSYAVIDAADGDTVSISGHSYNETLWISGQEITLAGAGEGVTVLDGAGLGQRVVWLANGSVVTITGMTIQNGQEANVNGGGGILSEHSDLTLIDVTLFNNSATSAEGGGLKNRYGTVVLSHTTVASNTASTNGGGLAVSSTGASLTLINSTVISNVSLTGAGGAIYAGRPLTMIDSDVISNTAQTGGGGIYVYLTTATLTGVTIQDNAVIEADKRGGGIYNSGTVHMSGGTIALNRSIQYGGGIYSPSGSHTTLTDVTIEGNSSGTGGGIYAVSDDMQVTGCTIQSNQATAGGGIRNHGTITVTASTILSNTATSSGGGVSNYSGTMIVEDSDFIGNQAEGSLGGGIYNRATMVIARSSLERNKVNTAGGLGGGIHIVSGGVMTMTETAVFSNTAAESGGGVYNDGTAWIDASAIYWNTTGVEGSGIKNDASGDLWVTNTTVSGNRTYGNGGGIENRGDLVLTNCTLTENVADFDDNGTGDGGGFAAGPSSGGSAAFRNTIVAENHDEGKEYPDCVHTGGSITSNEHNLVLMLSLIHI